MPKIKNKKILVHFSVAIIFVVICLDNRRFVGISFFILFFKKNFPGTLDKYGNPVLDSFEDEHKISFDDQLSGKT